MPGVLRILLRVAVAVGFGVGLYYMLPALPAPPLSPDRAGSVPAAEAGEPDAAPPVCDCACDCAPTPADVGAAAREPTEAEAAREDEDAPKPAPRPASGSASSPSPAAGTPARIDVNRAPASLLQTLPGIGPKKALRILEARAARPFSRPEDLVRVKGIGPNTIRRLLPLITVSPSDPSAEDAGG